MEILLFLIVYFVPSMVAAYRSHNRTIAVFFLNLFAGWSVIGWVVALVWALVYGKEE